MNRIFRIRRATLTLAALAVAAVLSGCFLVPADLVTFGVSVAPYSPEGQAPYCYGLEVKATFGVNVLMDASFDQDDLTSITTSSEPRASKAQRYYAGMPLVVSVVCLDDTSTEIGSASYEGTLVTPNESSHFTLWNYEEPAVDPNDCIAPTTSTGAQVCAITSGFAFP